MSLISVPRGTYWVVSVRGICADLGSDTESTASITSSIFENHYFQGRSYANPKYGKHW